VPAGEKGDPAARLLLDRYKGDRGLPGAPGEPGLAGLEGSPGKCLTAWSLKLSNIYSVLIVEVDSQQPCVCCQIWCFKNVLFRHALFGKKHLSFARAV